MDGDLKKNFHVGLAASLAASLATAGVAGFLLLKFAMPQYYFRWYPAVPVFFIVLCVALPALADYLERRRPDNAVMVFFAMKAVKMIMLVGGLLLYFLLVGDSMIAMTVTVFVFFVVYLAEEIRLYCKFEKKINRNLE